MLISHQSAPRQMSSSAVKNHLQDGKNIAASYFHDKIHMEKVVQTPFVQPLPIINPPEGCTQRTRLPWSYRSLHFPHPHESAWSS